MIRLTDLSHNANAEMIANDLDHGSLTDDLVSGVDAIINVGFEGQTGTDTDLMDYHTRCVYNLLYAAAGAGVSRFINISTLRLYENHEENHHPFPYRLASYLIHLLLGFHLGG